jgi:hypothetical protein
VTRVGLWVDASTWLYGGLLRALPRGFRTTYEPHIAQVFRTQCREALATDGVRGLARAWIDGLTEVAMAAVGERLGPVERTVQAPSRASAGAETELSLVLPLFNEADGVPAIVAGWSAWLDRTGLPAEIVLLDDGSADPTAQAIQAAASSDDRVRVLRHGTNAGWARSVAECLLTATGRYALAVEAVAPPEDLAALASDVLTRLTAGTDLVVAHDRAGRWRVIGANRAARESAVRRIRPARHRDLERDLLAAAGRAGLAIDRLGARSR